MLGRILEAKGDAAGAREHISKYLELDKNTPDAEAIRTHLKISEAGRGGSRAGVWNALRSHKARLCMPHRRTVRLSMVLKIRFSTARPNRITVSNPAKTSAINS